MRRVTMATLIALFVMNGCGSSSDGAESTKQSSSAESTEQSSSADTSTITEEQSEFAYKTQRRVKVSISIAKHSDLAQYQILLYEKRKVDHTPVGDLVAYDGLLTEGTASSTKGEYQAYSMNSMHKNRKLYTTKLTLGNHVTSVWVVIPALSYAKEHSIVNNTIVLTVQKGS